MTVAAYQVAYESAIAFGMRTSLNSDLHQQALKARRRQLVDEIAALKSELSELASKCEQIQTRGATSRAEDVSAPAPAHLVTHLAWLHLFSSFAY
jgi:predicted RNase H-like nuclease (RuvC/YqgF family)